MPDQDEEQTMRYFYLSFNGLHPETGKNHSGHIAFDCPKFPAMLLITDYIIPEILKIKYKGVLMTFFYEFKNKQDFEDFIDGGGMDEQINELLQ